MWGKQSAVGVGIFCSLLALAMPARAGKSALRTTNAADIQRLVTQTGGKAVLVNVWSTWCAPCKREIPELLRLRQKYRDAGFRLLLVSTDPITSRRDAERFLRKVGVDFPTWIKNQPDAAFIEGLDKKWSGAQPFNLLYDQTGAQQGRWVGEVDLALIEQAIKNLLAT